MPAPSNLSSGIVFNPIISGSISAAKNSAKQNIHTGLNGIPWYILLAAIIVIAWIIWLFATIYWTLPDEGIIRNGIQAKINTYGFYANKKSSRKGLADYLDALKKQGVPEEHFAVTNFFVSSANTPAIFTPIRDGIASPDALRLTLAAGARYLDLELHPTGQKNNFIPNVTAMDEGSKWREITMNKLSFKTVMQTIVKYGLAEANSRTDLTETPYMNDPLFIMLRFKGTPNAETYKATAKVLQETIEKMRLDFIYNRGRQAEQIFKMPITLLFNKVIIMCNVYPSTHSELMDYINIGPRGAPPLDLSIGEIIATPEANKPKLSSLIQQNLTVTRVEMEEPNCNVNEWNWKKAHEVGVHFAAMNFWSLDDNLTAYVKPDVFGVNSFLLKPAPLRYVIEYVKPPLLPNPALDARDGKPRMPQSLTVPG
jgi:hypothetical protein